MRIIVLMGGDSREREISLASGKAVAAALSGAGHAVEAIEIPDVAAVMNLESLRRADVVFPALHGGAGEDGHLQALLDLMGVRYAMSGPLASAIAMDKAATKRFMRGAGIPTPDWLLVDYVPESAEFSIADLEERAHAALGYPMVVKPNADGSSVGVTIVQDADDFARAFSILDSGCRQVLIETFIPGRELTSTIFLGRRLPLVEIVPAEGFYDFAHKYTDGASRYLCPADVASPVYEKMGADARRLYDLLGCRGVARVDFRLDGEDYACLEVNTVPGMTSNSLVPKAAAVVGIDFATLLGDLCEEALARPL